MFELLGYSADTETATAILKDTSVPHFDTNTSTLIILEEIGRIWEKMGTGEVNIGISQGG